MTAIMSSQLRVVSTRVLPFIRQQRAEQELFVRLSGRTARRVPPVYPDSYETQSLPLPALARKCAPLRVQQRQLQGHLPKLSAYPSSLGHRRAVTSRVTFPQPFLPFEMCLNALIVPGPAETTRLQPGEEADISSTLISTLSIRLSKRIT